MQPTRDERSPASSSRGFAPSSTLISCRPEGHELPVFEPTDTGRGMLIDPADKQALWELLDDENLASLPR